MRSINPMLSLPRASWKSSSLCYTLGDFTLMQQYFFLFFGGNRKTIIKNIRVGVGEEVGAFKG
jgi:hypothetical protein